MGGARAYGRSHVLRNRENSTLENPTGRTLCITKLYGSNFLFPSINSTFHLGTQARVRVARRVCMHCVATLSLC